jgi:alpha-methylacyl-CoA racemase
VLVVDRPAAGDLGLKRERWYDVMMRGKRSVTLDLKTSGTKDAALQLVSRADILIEGFRPGVMERLGLGPD